MKHPALFLDRDGVINIDHGYVYHSEDFDFIDGIFELCRAAKESRYLLIVVTNQAGIGRGYYTEADFHQLTDWMCDAFVSEGVSINGVYFCPYHPEHGVGKYKIDAPCRKPRPGMFFQAAEEHDIDLVSSVLIGDKGTDIEAGMAAGVGLNMLFSPGHSGIAPFPVLASLLDAIPLLEQR